MDRNREPLFDGRLPEQLDKEIEELIKSSNNMRVKASLIPLFWSDDLRTKYREECHEYLHEKQKDKEDEEIRTSILVNILNSYKSEKKELAAICDEFEGRTKESGKALSSVISNLSHNKLKTELSDMLLHRIHQLKVIAHLSHDEETDSWFANWKKEHKYGETMEAIAKHEKDFRAKKPDNKYRGLSINSLIDKLKEPALSDEERLEIIGGYEIPDSNATHERVRSIDDVDSTIKVRLEKMMLERVNQNDDIIEPEIPVNVMSMETRNRRLKEASQLTKRASYREYIRNKYKKELLEAMKGSNQETGEYKEFE